MPRLLLFAPCEKVVVDQTDNTTSVIGLLEAINVAIPIGEKPEIEGQPIPVSWYVITLWQTEPGDEGKHFESRLSIRFGKSEEHVLNPSGVPIAFEPNKPNFRAVAKIIGMPLDELLGTETFNVVLSIREEGADHWTFVTDFPVVIQRPSAKK